MFKLFLMLGKIGFFQEQGLRNHAPSWYPKARVLYPDGNKTNLMAIGTAVSYAKMFGGKVIR